MPQPKHIIAFARILFLLILAANSGFTMVLHTCQMPEMSCCEPSDRTFSAVDRCDYERGIAISRQASSCCQLKVVGGVDSKPISADRADDGRIQKLSVVGAISHTVVAACSAFSVCSTSLPSLPERAEPNPVNRYVLNATFLI